MKTISTFDLRNKLGRVIDEVHYTRKPVVVLKKHKPVVKIEPVDEQPRGHFDIEEYRKLVKSLPRKYQIGDPSPELLKIIGSGTYVALEDEDKVVEEYLRKRHGG